MLRYCSPATASGMRHLKGILHNRSVFGAEERGSGSEICFRT
jgi:hypothetical protein